jgi:hypothetical protein
LSYAVAQLSVELGISPVALLDAPPGILEAMFAYLKERNKKSHGGKG